MRGLLSQVETTVQSRRLLPQGERILVAVSGGADSMTLLHLLQQLAARHRWRLVVAHFNHQLRGRRSDADEALVRRTAAQLGLPCAVQRGDVRSFARQQKLSVEMAARRLRHEFLAVTARSCGIKTVVLAHHADDQVELFFLRLLRGAGSEGLAGMAWSGPSPNDPCIRLVRPLLNQPKEMLLEYVHSERIPFREDASNRSRDVLRNRIRLELVPQLIRHYQPALKQVILRQMDILAAESECLIGEARRWFKRRHPAFERLSEALQRHCLRSQLFQLGEIPTFDLVEQLRGAPDVPVTMRPGVTLRRDQQGQIRRRVATEAAAQFPSGERAVALNHARGEVDFASLRFKWSLVRARKRALPRFQDGCEWFDAERVGSIIRLRHWRAGDRFQPIGLDESVKLQDLFVNARVPREQRAQRVVATTSTGEIWWVEGLRIGEKFKLNPTTRHRLKWRWQRSERIPGRVRT
jgi:tRNA(Ile)-lysidine synthase